jgi:hypothetical protein
MKKYYKCHDCFSLIVLESASLPRDTMCGVCGGKDFRYMGDVRKDNIVNIKYDCPCNELCTCATGPKCDCKCGGENHGTHLVIEVVVVVGKVPTATSNRPGVLAGERGRWYRGEMEDLRAHLRDRFVCTYRYRAAEYMSWAKRVENIGKAWKAVNMLSRPPFPTVTKEKDLFDLS